ncbi:MAG TPA: DUF3014 domain-containing protein [Longimicrobiales bacterium]|nr:DUF3014 domain-containing protein [Longimicrobiales bacterium]
MAVGIVAVLAAAAWWGWSWFQGQPEAPPATAVDTATVDTMPPAAAGMVDLEPFEDLPPLAASDEWLREEAAELSSDPQWPSWLGTDGLVGRVVLGVVNVAAGESPAEQLPFLQPSDTFAVVAEGDRTFADPENGRRYNAVIGAVTSLDARASARFYRGMSPLLEAGLRELGLVDREFDELARSALDLVLEAEVPEGPVEVEHDGAVWVYVDPELETLSPATKHLLRIGPDNLLRLQDWARSFAAASGLDRDPRP